jgi:ABC-type polysaccharide/polyol phosphate export permease
MTDISNSPRDMKWLAITAAEDLRNGLRSWKIAGRLGWLDIKRRYRRTMIGPFWNTISLALLVTALGSLGVGLWNQEAGQYIPYLASGLVIWIMISTIVSESCSLMIAGQNLYRQIRFDYSVLALALIWRNFIVFLHNLLVYAVAVLIFAPHLLRPVTILVVPGILLILANSFWLAILLGLLCLRFRDIQQLVNNVIQIAIFVTPVFWPSTALQGTHRAVFVALNPLYHMIEVARAPLVGEVPTMTTYAAVLLMLVVGGSVTYWFFQKFRKRITYWT